MGRLAINKGRIARLVKVDADGDNPQYFRRLGLFLKMNLGLENKNGNWELVKVYNLKKHGKKLAKLQSREYKKAGYETMLTVIEVTKELAEESTTLDKYVPDAVPTAVVNGVILREEENGTENTETGDTQTV